LKDKGQVEVEVKGKEQVKVEEKLTIRINECILPGRLPQSLHSLAMTRRTHLVLPVGTADTSRLIA
jgi:hypothetical protein